jgi:hypothetical protein
MELSSNRELYEYLVLVASQLWSRGVEALSKDLAVAARTAGAVPAAEFLGGSRIALRRVLAEENGILSPQDRAELQEVLIQVEMAFDWR